MGMVKVGIDWGSCCFGMIYASNILSLYWHNICKIDIIDSFLSHQI